MSKEYPSYKTVKVQFEETHFKVKEPFCYCEYDKESDAILFHSKEERRNLYENMYYSYEETTEKKGTEMKSKPLSLVGCKTLKLEHTKELIFYHVKSLMNIYLICGLDGTHQNCPPPQI